MTDTADRIQIFMLGRFEVIVNDERVDTRMGKAKKGWTLLKYLILHRNENVPYYDLHDVLASSEESANPENALKTLVSRMRAFLSKCSPALSDCILTTRGSYRWNTDIQCEIDLFEFEDLARDLDSATELTDDVRANMKQLMSLYTGDLLPDNSQESWAVSRCVALHNLYLKTVCQYVNLLKANERYDDVIETCRVALDIDAFDERLHLDLMDALVKVKRNNEALMQYKHATSMHMRYLGMRPPEGIQDFYKQIIETGHMLNEDIDSIRKELLNYTERKGAFVCEYAVFKEIYNLQMRNLERTGTVMFLALIMISSIDEKPMDPLKLDDIMRNLLDVLRTSLRKGDTITHYSPSQYVLLLPAVTYDSSKMVMERLKRGFYKICPNSSVLFNYSIGPISGDAKANAARE